ncbi:MAG: hypothetical protein KAF91_02410 [Nostoc sp. TH1S01]|nr:hypothetical protein [Nostoc sp. TH1S01]
MTTFAGDKEFLLKLREDMYNTRQRRFQYQLAKVTSITTLLGAGGLLVEKLQLTMFFYIIPFLAIAFDFFILGESFTLRRIASFIQVYKQEFKDAESKWEEFVKKNPDRFSSVANFIITVSSSLGCFLILFLKDSTKTWFFHPLNIFWFCSLIILLILLRIIERRMSKRQWIQ